MALKEIFKNKKNIYKIVSVLAVVIVVSGTIYYLYTTTRVYIEKAEVSASSVGLSSRIGGTLQEVMVKEGDRVSENEVVARVGDELIKAKADGIITNVNNDIGKNFSPAEAVVTMINPKELRIVGHLDEDKGLKNIKVGQQAFFTVDAFGSKKYIGTVDEVSETSRASGVVFSISDKREVKQFDVKVRFNIDDYPELKNGMSAKIWVQK
jgi:multidrug resistance efflux pump